MSIVVIIFVFLVASVLAEKPGSDHKVAICVGAFAAFWTAAYMGLFT